MEDVALWQRSGTAFTVLEDEVTRVCVGMRVTAIFLSSALSKGVKVAPGQRPRGPGTWEEGILGGERERRVCASRIELALPKGGRVSRPAGY